jgi:hypothetical protein
VSFSTKEEMPEKYGFPQNVTPPVTLAMQTHTFLSERKVAHHCSDSKIVSDLGACN